MENLSLNEFSKITASNSPVPGGGGVSAAVASLAASLSNMVTALTTGKKKYAEYEDEIQALMKESEQLRIDLLKCINGDAEAFEPLSKAYAMPKDTPGYEETLEACLVQAASSPMQILKITTRIVEIDERLAIIGSKLAVSDAATSVMLAHGVLYGATINVLVNTKLMKNKDVANSMEQEAKSLLDEYSSRAIACYHKVEERL